MRRSLLTMVAAVWTRPLIAIILAGTSLTVAAAGAGSLAVGAVVLSKSNCKFSSGAMTLAFGTINPASTANATATATHGFSCQGTSGNATFSISAGNGLWYSGGMRRMQNGTITTEFMAYSLAVSPTSATVPKGSLQTLTVSGTIAPSDFQNVAAGNYSDTVAITLTP